jgi:hypothetical protein
MAKKNKGSELNNVNETWNRNERLRQQDEAAPSDNAPAGSSGVSDDLTRTIQREAAEYDNADKEGRLLDGDRATVNDHPEE